MVLELRFSKDDDDIPWGFRLTGGSDCDIPLTVIKVYEDSLAENAGLQADDIIVRINNICMSQLTHIEAHDVLMDAGRNFVMAIRRGETNNNVQTEDVNREEICTEMENSLQELSVLLESKQKATESSSVEFERTMINSSITDEQIAEAISGEAEVLPDQNIMGVNFNKIDLSGSTVLKALEEQKAETKIDLQNKKWSTFLQRPERARVIPKKKEPDVPVGEPYRVIIKKQKKKNVETTIEAPEETSATITAEEAIVTETETEEQNRGLSSKIEEEEEEEEPTPAEEDEENQSLPEEKDDNESQASKEEEEQQQEENEENFEEKQSKEVAPLTNLSLEDQLAQVQQQLEQLAQLPSTIQVTLDAVTQQLAKIVRASNRLVDEEANPEQTEATNDEEVDNQISETEELGPEIEDQEQIEEEEEEDSLLGTLSELSDREEVKESEFEIEEASKIEAEMEEEKMKAEKSTQQERVNHWNAVWPWSDKTKPIYRINFLKYQPPPKNLDYLQNSEVFRLVHDMDPPRKGIAARPGMIASEQDYYNAGGERNQRQVQV